MEGGKEVTSARQLGISDDERAANDEWRTEEIVDGSSPFGDEETLSFTRLAALKISRDREHAHGRGTGVRTRPVS